MVSVMIIEGVYNYNEPLLYEFHEVYVPLLASVLRCNIIKCEIVDLKGLARKYNITSRGRESLLYVPKIEFGKSENDSVSFIYTDSTSSVSPAFRVAANIRKLRSDDYGKKIVFVEQLKDSEVLKGFSPLIMDNIRINKSLNLKLDRSVLSELTNSVAKGIASYYGLDVE